MGFFFLPFQHEFCKKYLGSKKKGNLCVKKWWGGGGRNQGLGHFIQELFPRVDKFWGFWGIFFQENYLFRSIQIVVKSWEFWRNVFEEKKNFRANKKCPYIRFVHTLEVSPIVLSKVQFCS
jgi:hypothetical protein